MNNQGIGNGFSGGLFSSPLSGGVGISHLAAAHSISSEMAARFAQQQPIKPIRKKVECRVVEPESTIPESTYLLYGGG